MVIWVKRASDSQTNPRLKIEVVDSGGVSAGVEREIVNTTYQPLAFTFDEFTTSGAFNWSSIAFLKVHLLPSIQWSNPAPIYVDNWNIANVSKQYPDEVDWNTSWGVTMSSVNDPSEGYSAKSMQLHGNATTGEGHIGGVRGTLRADCADWSAMEAMRITMRRGTNSAANPDFSMELKDTAGRSVFLGRLIETSDYVEYTIPKSDMSIASGFDWTQLDAIQINMGTTNIAVLPADIYVKKIELGTMVDASTISDWSDYDGVEIWARRETSAEPDPVLMLEVLSGTYTANAARTVSSKGVYEPLRIYCDDFSVDSGFSWANVTELRVGMLSTTNGVQPGDLCMDAWSVVATEKTLYDQDWWTPWVDTNDPTGTNEFEFKLESDAVIGGTNVLTLSGLDQDNATNSVYGYIGGSGFSVRAFECDWSDYTHFKITARRDSVGEANPVIQVTITDKNGKTAHIGRTVKNTGYLRQCCSFADMEPEAGFDWSAIEDVKFELLTDEAHVTPGKLYIQDFVLGVMPNESPRDWTPFNGMELKTRRANETNTYPLLRVTLESEVGSVTNTAYSFIAVRNTNDTFKAMRIPLVEMHQSARPFPWDNVSSVKVELFTEEKGVIPDAVYLDDWRLVNLSVNPDDEVRNGMTDYVRQLRDGKRYFLFQQDAAFQRMVSPYAAWTRELGAIVPTNGAFQVRLPVQAEAEADVVVELYNSEDRKLGEGRTTVDAGRDYTTVTIGQTNEVLADRSSGYYYKTYVTTVGGTTNDALAWAEETDAFVRDINPTVEMVALPKILRPGDSGNIVVRYASAQAGWLTVNLVDAENTVRGTGNVFVQGGSSDQWIYLAVDADAPQVAGYYLHAYLSSTEDGGTPVSEVDYVSVALKQYVDSNKLYYVAPREITPNQTVRMPIGYTIVSNKFNVLMELVDASS
ncbi:MAG: hypothetical protein PHG65_12980, partial [Kiritimatiellae bacterium]|nr:hypothetical protein [Kiritimatiellia bacterium]